MTAVEPRRILTHQDRCDWPRCGAAAYHRVIFEAGPIDACNHHLNEAPESFLGRAIYHIDESWAV